MTAGDDDRRRKRLAAVVNRRLDPDDVQRYLVAPITDDEREAVRALVAWFRRRYPTAADRLAYVRRAHARWLRRD